MADDRPTSRGESHPDGRSPYGETASALSALGRARQHALSDPSAAGGSGTGVSGGPKAGAKPAGAAHVRGGPKLGKPPTGIRLKSRRGGLGRPRWRRRRRAPGFARKPQHGPRRHRSLRSLALAVVLVGVAAVVLVGVFSLVQLSRAVPEPVVHAATLPAAHAVSSPRPALPWPRDGEAAVGLAGYGTLGSAGPSTPVPIASLAKVMVALVLLHDHPLASGRGGPTVTITPADQAAYRAENSAGDSVAPVTAGEHITEMNLLQALLIPSADNIAQVLARWDAGSDPAFVARMNATAAALGMHHSHYADENGLSSGTTSTASDQLRLAAAAAANPVLMSIVRQPSVVLPDGTVLNNYDTLLGQSGVVGIKTGSTLAAGGCFMLAADAKVAGHRVVVLAVVLGQHVSPFITSALNASRALVAPAARELHTLAVLPAGTTVAWVTTPWGQPVPVRTTRRVSALVLAGTPLPVAVHVTPASVHGSPRAGSQVATVTVTAGDQVTMVPAVTAGPVPSASVRWRLERL